MKNKLILVLALLIGVVAFWLSAEYMKRERDRLYAGIEKVTVIVAKRDLPAMTVLTFDDLALREEYKSAVGKDAFLQADQNKLIGKRLKYSVERAQMLQWSYVDISRETQSGLAPIISSGRRAMSIAISGAAAVSGLVKPNDHVDILGTFSFPSRTNPQQVENVTRTLMEDVTVLATGQQLARQNAGGRSAQQGGGYSTVTVELDPIDVQILVFAQQARGQLYLSLRNPNDVSSEDDLPSVNFDYIEAELRNIRERRKMDRNSQRSLVK